MALIQDPDFLNQNIEVVFNTTAKTVQLLQAGNLSSDGVTFQALYSFTKEEWKNDSSLIRYEFPFIAITPEQFEFVNGWTPADTATVNLLRNAGFAVKNTDGSSAEEYIGVITLGNIGSLDQVYFQQEVGGAASNIVLTGPVNQCVKVYGDASNGNFDYRTYFKLFVREQAKTYSSSNHSDIGVTEFTYQAYRFPLANQADLKVTELDGTVDAYGVSIDYTGGFSRTIGGASYNFDVVINGNNKTAEEIYMAVQSALRKNADIDSGVGTVVGKTANALLTFVGDTLITSTGVYIDNFNSLDTNRIEFFDSTGTKRTFPFVAAGTITFNQNLVDDGSAVYRMFYSDTFGTASATLVKDNAGNDIAGVVSSNSVSFDFDYDGQTVVEDKAVTVVAIGLGTAQYVLAQGTITRTTANSISLVSSLERNYTNN